MDKNIILLTNGVLARYKPEALSIAVRNGFDAQKHVDALRALKNNRNASAAWRNTAEDNVALTHPANFLSETLFERYF